MEGFSEIMTFEKSTKYLPIYRETRSSKIPTVKAEHESNNEVIVKVPYNRKILGQKNSKTIEIYTHVSKVNRTSKKNPMNNMKGEKIRYIRSGRIYPKFGNIPVLLRV